MNKNNHLKDLPMSNIGYGCYAISGAYGMKLEESQMIKILQEAYNLGVRFYDTSNKYGNTEEILGKAVKHFRDKITIASKVGLTEGNNTNLTKPHVIASCESSLKKLKTDYLDIYQIHFDDPNTPVSETVEALEELKKEGKIRHYGVGHLPLDRTLEYLKLGDVSTVLAEMSAVSTLRYKELHPLQRDYDFGIIAFSVTGRGLLSGKIKPDTHFNKDDFRSIDPLFKKSKIASGLRIVGKLMEIGARYKKSPVQVTISWTIQKPGVSTVLTGPTKLEHLKENLKVLEWELNKADIEELDCFLKKEEIELEKLINIEIYNILNSSLPSNFEQASNDLIYVMENAIENQLLSHKAGIPIYMSILRMKKANNKSLAHLSEIQKELNSLIEIKNVTIMN